MTRPIKLMDAENKYVEKHKYNMESKCNEV